MTSELKTLHPYLYRRIRLKGILFSLLGLSSIFSVQLDAFFHAQRNTSAGLSSTITGSIFLAIGIGILYGLYGGPKLYEKVSRKFLYAALTYALFWEFTLLFLAFAKHITTVSIFILWGYLVYNLLLVSRDSGWKGAEIVREIRDDGDV